jgi:hypothetical protein
VIKFQKSTFFDLHDVDVADLDLFPRLDDIEGQGGGASDAARQRAAHKIGAKIGGVRSSQLAAHALKQRPIDGREGDVTEQGGRVTAPQASENRRNLCALATDMPYFFYFRTVILPRKLRIRIRMRQCYASGMIFSDPSFHLVSDPDLVSDPK